MNGAAGASLARMAQAVRSAAGRLALLWLGRAGGHERDGAQREIFTSYGAPVCRPKEPPYASLRQ
jgi:hypothetical protein